MFRDCKVVMVWEGMKSVGDGCVYRRCEVLAWDAIMADSGRFCNCGDLYLLFING